MSLILHGNLTNVTDEQPNWNSSDYSHHHIQAFKRSINILFIPLSLIALFFILSAVVYYMLKKRRLDQLRHHLVPMYTFDPGEGDDWETEVLEPTLDIHQPRKIHDYKTMDTPNVTSPRL